MNPFSRIKPCHIENIFRRKHKSTFQFLNQTICDSHTMGNKRVHVNSTLCGKPTYTHRCLHGCSHYHLSTYNTMMFPFSQIAGDPTPI